jgi:hypothetical protein
MGAMIAPVLEGRDTAERQEMIDRYVHEALDELASV